MKVISLFDYTGTAVKPWLEAGYECHIFDMRHPEGKIEKERELFTYGGDISEWKEYILRLEDVAFLSAFPPCTDLAVSGAGWFKRKREIDPTFQDKAMSLVYLSRDIGEEIGCPFYVENPVSIISTKWRKPDYKFNPYDYTDIEPKDNYSKKTCLWTGGGYKHPSAKRAVSTPEPDRTYIHMMGSKRGELGSNTPRGFAIAVYLENKSGTQKET